MDSPTVYSQGIPDFLDCNAVDNADKVGPKKIKLNDVLQKYKEVRSMDWSKILGVQAKLTLIPNASPVFLKARTVPFKIIELLDRELNELSKVGVLEKIETSEWTTPIVPILKADGRIRICGDYRATVNPKLMVDEHPLPTIDEIFAKLAGGKKFSKIDLRQAYLQLEVDSKSSKVLTLNTHRGLYKVNRFDVRDRIRNMAKNYREYFTRNSRDGGISRRYCRYRRDRRDTFTKIKVSSRAFTDP